MSNLRDEDLDLRFKDPPRFTNKLPTFDISPIIERYSEFIRDLKLFLETEQLPVTKSMLISYASKCTDYETALISLKSELSMAKSELSRDYRTSYRSLYGRSTLGQKWETKIEVDMDPIISDIQYNLDKVNVMVTCLEEFKWTLKTNRDIAKQYILHVNDFVPYS